jgi:putative MATE family efflux protein
MGPESYRAKMRLQRCQRLSPILAHLWLCLLIHPLLLLSSSTEAFSVQVLQHEERWRQLCHTRQAGTPTPKFSNRRSCKPGTDVPINFFAPFPLTRNHHSGGIHTASCTSLHTSGSTELSAEESGTDTVASVPTVNYNWTPLCLQIAVPAFVGMLADPLLSLMDTAYVGRVGTTELAALGACTSIFHLAFNAFRATTAATTSLVATQLSISEKAGDKTSAPAKQVTAISLWFAWWVGLLVSGTLYLTGHRALASMGVPASSALFPAAKDYLYARLWAAPAVLFIGVAEGAFRGYCNTMVPLVASLIAAALNLVLDPLLMFAAGWGVRGAAAATAISQVGAAATYAWMLTRRQMLPQRKERKHPKNKRDETVTATAGTSSHTSISRIKIIRTILGANAAMLMKQGSLLLGWAYATARATRLGADHVAAHQVGLSVWLVFALILDGAAVSAQVLMSRAYAQADKPQVRSLTLYMLKLAVAQGIVSMLIVDGIDLAVPQLFTRDPIIQGHLHQIMPHLAWQQILVSLTLVVESLAVGANQFRILAAGTALSTFAAVWQISKQTTVEGIWSIGIVSLFVGRLLTASLGCVNGFRKLKKKAVPTG